MKEIRIGNLNYALARKGDQLNSFFERALGFEGTIGKRIRKEGGSEEARPLSQAFVRGLEKSRPLYIAHQRGFANSGGGEKIFWLYSAMTRNDMTLEKHLGGQSEAKLGGTVAENGMILQAVGFNMQEAAGEEGPVFVAETLTRDIRDIGTLIWEGMRQLKRSEMMEERHGWVFAAMGDMTIEAACQLERTGDGTSKSRYTIIKDVPFALGFLENPEKKLNVLFPQVIDPEMLFTVGEVGERLVRGLDQDKMAENLDECGTVVLPNNASARFLKKIKISEIKQEGTLYEGFVFVSGAGKANFP
ncbi:hypothetical protein COV61_02390 [Candidatus Micrarchaeota archaeon CG11_big_fil_rev_8_21_14_0_20_47_5]|nr:MAG: hypothetical protein AUJ17_04060 [Candidatus Micrarchaeota archaeon CG1_02_47_40]PIN83694.1 MAG: hypothetical protein COV61_02390 [Candidatus Micrarchaeota archaeon CG11_big_fil_rev_8_21_14_0_20_47_5]QBM01410.1 hypothetical protein [uncultured archaeon]